MKTYLEKLHSAYSDGNLGKKELKILERVWRFFKIELLPYKYLPLHYSLFWLYGISFLFVSAVVLFMLMAYSISGANYTSMDIYNNIQHKYFVFTAGMTSIWLITTALSKHDRRLNWCNDSQECWRENHACVPASAKVIYIVFFISTGIASLLVFQDAYITFIIISLSLVAIYESFVSLSRFSSIKNWVKTPVIDCTFSIKEEKEISRQFKKTTLYSLQAMCSYKVKGKVYCTSQIYLDEPRDGELFKTKELRAIKKWILEHENYIDEVYVNPNMPTEAVIFKDILGSSVAGKVAIIFGALLVVYLVTNHIVSFKVFFD
jgi:hypothetical protein